MSLRCLHNRFPEKGFGRSKLKSLPVASLTLLDDPSKRYMQLGACASYRRGYGNIIRDRTDYDPKNIYKPDFRATVHKYQMNIVRFYKLNSCEHKYNIKFVV